MNDLKYFVSIVLILGLLVGGLIGWVKSVSKFVGADFQAPYKAEVLYGIGTFSGLGAILGYMNFGK